MAARAADSIAARILGLRAPTGSGVVIADVAGAVVGSGGGIFLTLPMSPIGITPTASIGHSFLCPVSNPQYLQLIDIIIIQTISSQVRFFS